MRKCSKCGTPWVDRAQPRPRRICTGCGAYLHTCVNCHHFDGTVSNSCKLTDTEYIGPRDMINYCDRFEMVHTGLKAIEARTERARNCWEQLFRK